MPQRKRTLARLLLTLWSLALGRQLGSVPVSPDDRFEDGGLSRVTANFTRPFYAPHIADDVEFPLDLIRNHPGSRQGVRSEVGDDSRLREAIAKAMNETVSRTLTILVLGGSEPQGADCSVDMKGAVEAGVYAWWTAPKTGRIQCGWPARLTRYLARLLPRLNFVVINGAQGGCSSSCALTKVNAELGKRVLNEPTNAKWTKLVQPIGENVDLVLLDFNANDAQKPNCSAATFEALVHYAVVAVSNAVPTPARHGGRWTWQSGRAPVWQPTGSRVATTPPRQPTRGSC